jgi:hypothetical protein
LEDAFAGKVPATSLNSAIADVKSSNDFSIAGTRLRSSA